MANTKVKYYFLKEMTWCYTVKAQIARADTIDGWDGVLITYIKDGRYYYLDFPLDYEFAIEV